MDSNCLIALEKTKGESNAIRRLVGLHDIGLMTICVPFSVALERQQNGEYLVNCRPFEERAQELCRRAFEFLYPPLILDFSFVGRSVYAGEQSRALMRNLHRILFSQHEFAWTDCARSHGLDPHEAFEGQHREWHKWRNRVCDTLAIWCHLHYSCDCFVTDDGNFHKKSKKPALIGFGARSILYPEDAAHFIRDRLRSG